MATAIEKAEARKEKLLAEIVEMSSEVDFGRTFSAEDTLEVIEAAVAEGRKALKVEEDVKPSATKKETSLDIIKGEAVNGSRYVRTFCAAVHGEEYEALAKGFAAKHGGSVVPSSSVTALRVRWEENDKANDGRLTEKTKDFVGVGATAKEEAVAFARGVLGAVLVLVPKK